MSIRIRVEHLYKEYRLGTIGHGTLYRDVQSWWATVRGREDPNTLIGHTGTGHARDQVLALNDINLEIQAGEVLGIIGANGAGKSTLLKILSRVTAPTSGTIKVKGNIASLLEVGTGFHKELTGRENIYLNGAINGMDQKEVSRKLDEIVEFAGVEQFIDTPVKRYSSGMFVRLGFAVAAHLDPDIMVVDEVLAVGDASFQKKAIGKMQEVSKGEGRTVLFVSHNMDSIKRLCSRGILLKHGTISNVGSADEIVSNYLESAGSEMTGPEISFLVDPEKEYQVLSFGILNDEGKKTDYLDRTKSFQIFIKYALKTPCNDLDIHLGIATASNENGVYNNTSVLQWSNKHHRKYRYGDETIDIAAGTYRACITVPGYILNSGKYKLNVHLVYADAWYEYNEEGIVFELFDLGSSHTLRAGRSAGLLAMPLDWDSRQISGD